MVANLFLLSYVPKIAEPGNRNQDGRSPFSELQGYSLHVFPGTVLCCAEAYHKLDVCIRFRVRDKGQGWVQG